MPHDMIDLLIATAMFECGALIAISGLVLRAFWRSPSRGHVLGLATSFLMVIGIELERMWTGQVDDEPKATSGFVIALGLAIFFLLRLYERRPPRERRDPSL